MFLHGTKTTPNASLEQALETRLVAAAAASNGTSEDAIERFRAAAPLPDDANRLFDKAVLKVGRNRLAIADDVLSRGLTYPLPNWLSVPELYWESEADVGNVTVAMDPSTRMDGSLPDRSGSTMPIPAIVSTFQLGARLLLAAQRGGYQIDTSLFENHARRVNEQVEDIFLNGWAGTVGGNQIYGLANAPDKNTIIYEGSGMAWDNASKTGVEILTDVLAHVAALVAKNMYGPYTLYIPTEYENKLNHDYVSGYPKTIRARLEELKYGGENLRIVVADQITNDYTYMVQMTSNVIQAVVGQTTAQLSWGDGGPGWNNYYALLNCILPRIRSDKASQSGISVGFTS